MTYIGVFWVTKGAISCIPIAITDRLRNHIAATKSIHPCFCCLPDADLPLAVHQYLSWVKHGETVDLKLNYSLLPSDRQIYT